MLARVGGVSERFGWTAAVRDGRWYVGSVEPHGPAVRLRVGDRIISLDGDAYVGRGGVRPHRRGLKVGDAYEVVVARDDALSTHRLEVVSGPSRLAQRLSSFLVSLVWCVVGLFIGFVRPERPQGRLGFAAANAVGFVLLKVGVLTNLALPLWPLHAVLGYHFFYRFPAGVPSGRVWGLLLPPLYVGGAAATIMGTPLTWSRLTEGAAGVTRLLAEHPELWELEQMLGLAVFGAAVAGTLAVIMRNQHLVTDPDQRRRVRWVIYGSAVGLALVPVYALMASVEQVVGEGNTPWTASTLGTLTLAANCATVAIPLSVAYAVVKHRLFDIKVVLSSRCCPAASYNRLPVSPEGKRCNRPCSTLAFPSVGTTSS